MLHGAVPGHVQHLQRAGWGQSAMLSTTHMPRFYDRKCQFIWKILLLERKALQKLVIGKDFFCSCQDMQEFMSHCQNINDDRSDLATEPESPTIQVCAGIIKQWGRAICLSDTSFPPIIFQGVVCVFVGGFVGFFFTKSSCFSHMQNKNFQYNEFKAHMYF